MLWMMVATILGSIALTFSTLAIVFHLIRTSIAREAASLTGVERDSGPIKVMARYRRFRAPGMSYGGAIKGAPGQLVLTATHLYVLQRPQRYGRFARADLPRFTAGVIDGDRLQLRSEDPPGASGTVDYRMRVADPAGWVTALVAAGAKPLSG